LIAKWTTKDWMFYLCKPCTYYRYDVPMRYLSSWLSLGYPAAHKNDHLLLLPSGSDRVYGFLLRRT